MMQFDVLTIFPDIFNSYLKESLIAKAQKKKILKIRIHDLRKWSGDRRKTVDDSPYGGGSGMVLKIEPVYKAVQSLKPNSKAKTIVFTPRARKFSQKIAWQLAKTDRIVMICGRYEGVDERAAKHIADLQLSIGDYDLMGGELPAMVVIEAVSRLLPGVLGKQGLLKERITKDKGFIEYPQYTRPETFEPKKGVKWRVPKVLLSGDHKKIGEWRKKHGKIIGC